MIKTRVEPIGREIQLLIDAAMGPKARSAAVADFARQSLREAEQKNARALGRAPKHKTFVDGSEGNSEDNVKPDGGKIVYEFELVNDALGWIVEQLRQQHPPQQVTGRFARSFVVFADGAEVADMSKPPAALEYVVINKQPYARKLNRWFAIFEAVAALAQKRFGNIVKIGFSFRDGPQGPTPAIVVTVR